MNDLNVKISKKHLKYLFNEEDDILLNIKLDILSIYSITPYKFSNMISDIIYNKLKSYDITITDMTACIGGDTINFCKKFKHINAIEICKDRYEFLEHNLNLFKFNNCSTFNGDSIKIINKLEQDVIFIDMPWGGKNYKRIKKLKLYLSGLTSYTLCNKIKNKAKLICLKVPNNFDFNEFKNKIKFTEYNKYDLQKFTIITLQ
jgi:tRNA/tmRNA/rRNA uracil-C5-methylase (TrmA/RlmC/RlmD family)